MYFETLYKTKTLSNFEKGEYYQPILEFEQSSGSWLYFVREKHGYWSETEKRMANQTVTLSPEEGYASYAQARVRFDQQIKRRVDDGFVHAFYFDPMEANGIGYKFIG
jgi:hypothetical protein